jgi:hypothetical protein
MLMLVGYDLKAPNRNYDQLYQVLRSASAWWHHLESTWILYVPGPSNASTLQSWQANIRAAIDANDSFIIMDITSRGRGSTGWLPQKAWDWLRQQDPQ